MIGKTDNGRPDGRPDGRPESIIPSLSIGGGGIDISSLLPTTRTNEGSLHICTDQRPVRLTTVRRSNEVVNVTNLQPFIYLRRLVSFNIVHAVLSCVCVTVSCV